MVSYKKMREVGKTKVISFIGLSASQKDCLFLASEKYVLHSRKLSELRTQYLYWSEIILIRFSAAMT